MDPPSQVAVEIVDGLSRHLARQIEERRRVLARLGNDVADDQQSAIGFDRTGEVNLLPLAVWKVG